MLALPLLVESPTVASSLRLAAEVAPPPAAQPSRRDIRVLDPGARVLPLEHSLILSLVLRSLRNWSLVMVAAPSVPAPLQDNQAEREEVQLVSLLGAEPYALEVWLAASADPAVPRLAVLVDPSLSPLVQIHLERALTEALIQGVAVLLYPGLALSGVTGLDQGGPRD